MRDFFKECLEDLEARANIRQYYFLLQKEDGAKQAAILLDSMVIVSKEFAFIPEADQKKIITEMITKDQDYDGLSSRIIYKWLNAHRNRYVKVNQAEEIPWIERTEEEQKRADKILNAYLEKLQSGFAKPIYPNLDQEIKKIWAEDKERSEGKKASRHQSTPAEIVLLKTVILEIAAQRYAGQHEFKKFFNHEVAQGLSVFAPSAEEAKAIYDEAKVQTSINNQPQ